MRLTERFVGDARSPCQRSAEGLTKPAALFGAVAAVVETCGALLDSGGRGDSWAPVPAVVVAAALLATRKRPGPRRPARRR